MQYKNFEMQPNLGGDSTPPGCVPGAKVIANNDKVLDGITIYPDWELNIDFYPTTLVNAWTNLLRLAEEGNTDTSGASGSRLPAGDVL